MSIWKFVTPHFLHRISQLDDMDHNYIVSGYQEEAHSAISAPILHLCWQTHTLPYPGRINRSVRARGKDFTKSITPTALIKQRPRKKTSFIPRSSTKTSSLRCDNGGLREAAGCHQQKAKSETKLGLCARVWARCEGAPEVRRGKTGGVFTPAGRDGIPPGCFIVRRGRAREEEWPVKRRAASSINTYKGRWRGLFTGQLTNTQRDEWSLC